MKVFTIAQSVKVFTLEDPFGLAIYIPPPPLVHQFLEGARDILPKSSSQNRGVVVTALMLVCVIMGI